MIIRGYRQEDCREMAELFYHTVHVINAADYSWEQLEAWADGKVDLDKWNQSFLEHYTLVAVADSRIVGFGDMDKSGYLDRLYVHMQYQHRGIASKLCDGLEKHFPVERISTQASVTARLFFEKRGYCVVKEQTVIRSGVGLTNFIMIKTL